jgi:hypothetical protein
LSSCCGSFYRRSCSHVILPHVILPNVILLGLFCQAWFYLALFWQVSLYQKSRLRLKSNPIVACPTFPIIPISFSLSLKKATLASNCYSFREREDAQKRKKEQIPLKRGLGLA